MMKEEEAVAIMMANLKGPKNKPSSLLVFAEACRILIKKWGLKEMTKYFGVSGYMLRQIDKINELEPKYKKLVKEKKLRIEAAYQLWRLDDSKKAQVIKIIQNMNTEDIRTFVHFIRKNPSLSVAKWKELFEKTKPEEVHVLVVPLDSDTYNKVKILADKSKLKIHDYITKLVEGEISGKAKKKTRRY